MNRIRSTLLGAVLSALAFVSMASVPMQARAQVVVCANCSEVVTQYLQYAKEIEEYVEMVKQTELFVKQLTDLDNQLKAMITNRGFGRIAIEDYTSLMPTSYGSLQQLINSGGRIGSIAQQEMNLLSQLGSSYMSPGVIGSETVERFQKEIQRRAETKAVAAQEFESAQDRFSRLDYLRSAIEMTDDQKGILEVNARLSAENASAINELVKLMAASNFQDAQFEREKLWYQQQNLKAAAERY
ncbi:MAG: hypothetical protein LC098_04140 [Burkholderiales bacterium]|nr:hypothetical protein [Burkholderiales bacterium]